jgi:predicted DNA-binding transcriptional regulator AlpA
MTHPLKLCTAKELKTVYGIMFCRQHIWRLEDEGKFPLRVPAGNRRVGWVCVEIEAWLAAKIAAR